VSWAIRYDFADEAKRGHFFIDPALARSVGEFLTSFAEAMEAVRAAFDAELQATGAEP
jgi:hypothetical protein